MNLWPFKKKPWTYFGHEYVGVENQAYTYLVTFKRGEKDTVLRTYKFHAHTTNKEKDQAKLVRFFEAEAAQIA
jgi:hypothetical protein